MFESQRSPETNLLSNDELCLLGDVTAFVCGHSAKVLSERSHGAAWEGRRIGEEIPYESAYLMLPAETTSEDVAWAKRENERIRQERAVSLP